MSPDGRIARVRFEATTAPLCSFLSRSRLKRVVGIHPASNSLAQPSPGVRQRLYPSVTWTLRTGPSRCVPTGPSLEPCYRLIRATTA